MTFRWTSEVPPAMLAALLHNHCRCQKPQAARPLRAPRAPPPRDACVISDQVSLTQLDSGPGAIPFANLERVRQLWVLKTTSETYTSTRASATAGSSIVPRAAPLRTAPRDSPRGQLPP